MAHESKDSGDPGPPPDVEAIAELLGERYPLKKDERLSVRAETDPTPGLRLFLDSGRDRYEIAVDYLRGAKGRDPWMLLADAMDALFGSFIEADRAYRDLPTGTDVEFDGAFFRVMVERTIPELTLRADRMLEHD